MDTFGMGLVEAEIDTFGEEQFWRSSFTGRLAEFENEL